MKFKRIFFWSMLFLSVYYFFTPIPLGMLMAKFDIWRGHYEIRIYGYPSLFEPLMVERLKGYGIEYKRVSEICSVNYFMHYYVQGYNTVMEEGIAKDFPEEVMHLMKGEIEDE